MEALIKIIANCNAEMTGTGLPFIIAPLFIAAVLMIFSFYLREKRRIFRGLATFLHGRTASGFFKPTFQGLYDGLPLVIEHLPGQENIPERLRISLEKVVPLRMTVRRRGDSLLAELAKKRWLAEEIMTGNPEFDNLFCVYAGEAGPVSAYLSQGEVREAIKALFLLDYEDLEVAGHKVRLEKTSADLKILAADLYMPRLNEVLDKLSLLARNIPPGGK